MYRKRNWEQRAELMLRQRKLRYGLMGLACLTLALWVLTYMKF